MTKREAALKLIRELRSDGARMVKVGDVEAIFEGPPARREGEADPQADHEAEKRKTVSKRTLDDRLLRPLRIGKSEDAA